MLQHHCLEAINKWREPQQRSLHPLREPLDIIKNKTESTYVLFYLISIGKEIRKYRKCKERYVKIKCVREEVAIKKVKKNRIWIIHCFGRNSLTNG